MERLSLLVKPQIDEWGDITYVPTDLGLYITVVVIFLLVYSSILFSRGYRKSNDRAGKEQDSSRQAGDRLPGHLRSAFI